MQRGFLSLDLKRPGEVGVAAGAGGCQGGGPGHRGGAGRGQAGEGPGLWGGGCRVWSVITGRVVLAVGAKKLLPILAQNGGLGQQNPSGGLLSHLPISRCSTSSSRQRGRQPGWLAEG